jgi:micrococcal nuclease
MNKNIKVIFGAIILVIAVLLGVSSDDIPEMLDYGRDLDPMTVIKVVDGDTIKLASGDTIRYIGVDTPETVHPSKPVECFGKQASEKNKELVLDKIVRLEKDVSTIDRFDRLLRYVYVGDTFVNLELVEQGYAYAASFPPDVAHDDIFHEAELKARDQGRGLWSSCGVE